MHDILVVEDTPSFLRWVTEAITRHLPGRRVRTATTAKEAEAAIAASHPSIVVLDLALPLSRPHALPSTRAGMRLLRRLCAPPDRVPTVVLSSEPRQEDCLTAGARAFIAKSSPTVLPELLTALQSVGGQEDAKG